MEIDPNLTAYIELHNTVIPKPICMECFDYLERTEIALYNNKCERCKIDEFNKDIPRG